MWYFMMHKVKTIIIIVLGLLVLGFWFYPDSTRQIVGYAVANTNQGSAGGILRTIGNIIDKVFGFLPSP